MTLSLTLTRTLTRTRTLTLTLPLPPKVCGDPNVPAGQCSFSAWGEVFPASEARLLFPAQGACRCMNAFMCGCLTEHELARLGLGLGSGSGLGFGLPHRARAGQVSYP